MFVFVKLQNNNSIIFCAFVMSISIFVGSELYTPLQAEKTVMQMRTEHCTRTGSEEQRASRSVYRGADA